MYLYNHLKYYQDEILGIKYIYEFSILYNIT